MSKSHFKELKRYKNGNRSGILKTRRGPVKTPFFMPCASRGSVKGLQPSQIIDSGTQVLLANAYHLHLQPGEKVIKKLGGLHTFSGWQGPILTDSGGFQVFSLAKARKVTEEGVYFKNLASGGEVLITPEESMQIQFDLGSDIIMAFDDVTGLSPTGRTRSKEAMERTHRWLVRCITEFKKLTKNSFKGRTLKGVKGTTLRNKPLLFGIVQGGLDKNLRKKSLEFVQSQEVDGIAIGGLAVGETRKEMYDMLNFLAPFYDPARARYLMGVGEPADMRYAIERGIDIFDCVLPTRNGRHGQVWITGDKRLNLNNLKYANDRGPIDSKCDCHTCKTGYSRAFLRHLYKVGDPLAGSLATTHNLRYLARLCEEYQQT
ncbi:tRNA guanosine(34) transglycosylase Tgt [Candidatus Saccharibacteria bacterium]|nr:tRNA guanosine(34) transglycosylase Tgt [Candidatus Saccharibacteria bacterium]